MERRRKLCDVADVPPGSVRRVELPGCPAVVVCNVRGSFHVLDDTCSHGRASLGEGRLVGNEIECPRHRGRFDVTSGRATGRPAKRPVEVHATEVHGGSLFLAEPPIEARSEVCTLDGVNLHYVAWGEPRGEPVVLLHGLRAYAHWFDDLAETLATDHYVVAPDLRGRGASGHSPGGDYRCDIYVDDLEGLLREIGAERATLVGHSLGVMIAMLFTRRHPERVSRLVLIDLGPEIEEKGRERLRRELLDTPARFASWREAEQFVRGAHPTTEDRIQARLRWMLADDADGGVRWRLDDAIFSPNTPLEPAWRMWSALRRVRCPTLVVRGERSDTLSEKTVRAMIDLLPSGSRSTEVPDAGHMVLDDDPATASQLIAAFIREGG